MQRHYRTRAADLIALGGRSTGTLGVMGSAVSLFALGVTAGAATLAGCGVGCLYHENGKAVVAPNTQVTPERLVAAVGNALQPMGFTGAPWNPATPTSQRYWDYAFRNHCSLFSRCEEVEVFITYDDLSIGLSDGSRHSDASEFDRRVTSAIRDHVRSELGADITFSHPKPPPFCLGP